MIKLTQDQREDLAELLDSPAWDAVLALCQMSIDNHESRVLTADLKVSDREIVLLKARLEGARDMQRSIHNAKSLIGIKKEKKDA